MIKALSLGYRADIPRSHADLLRVTGTAHLLAISGLHIGMVAFLCQGTVCILSETQTVAEGVKTTRAVVELAEQTEA